MTTTMTMPRTREGIGGIYCRGQELDSAHVGPMRDSSDAVDDVSTLSQRMNDEGYLYLPGLLHRQEVLDARRSITAKLSARGSLMAGTDPMEGIVDPQGNEIGFLPELAQDDPAADRMLFDGPMLGFFERFLDAEVRHLDQTWLRIIPPGPATTSHCDAVFMGRGTTSHLFTAWTPWGDINHPMGGLTVLEGSNNNERLTNTYGKYDVDTYCENKPEVTGWKHGGQLKAKPNQLQKSLGGTWRVTEFEAGDVLIFTMHTIHAGLDNHTDRLRLSSDTRYQPVHLPVDERWVGPNPIGHGDAGKRGRIC